jgi:hypothetical protein
MRNIPRKTIQDIIAYAKNHNNNQVQTEFDISANVLYRILRDEGVMLDRIPHSVAVRFGVDNEDKVISPREKEVINAISKDPTIVLQAMSEISEKYITLRDYVDLLKGDYNRVVAENDNLKKALQRMEIFAKQEKTIKAIPALVQFGD